MDVVIAGGGPSGLMLGGELALAGVEVAIVERRASQVVDGSRAGGLLARTIEVLDQRGIAERFLSAGYVVPAQGFGGIRLDVSDIPTRHNYVLALRQSRFEPILADWVGELGVPMLRNHEVMGFAQDDTGVDVELSDGTAIRAKYLVGCDGGRSAVRKAAGIEFVGLDASTSWMIAEVEMDEEPQLGTRPEGGGIGPVNREEGGGPYGVVLRERDLALTRDPSMSDLREALVAVYGTDFGLRRASWISRFTDMARQAASYRNGRVLLAGDAAHVHPPQGGQGMQTGVQDAVNLGWKLAQVVNGTSPGSLLDSYHDERHPVGARVLHNTMAQVALSSPDERHQALRDTVTDLLSLEEPRRRIAAMLSGLDIHYDLGDGHPLLGRRMPDLDLDTADGATRVFTLLHDARPILLNLGDRGRFDLSPWADRVRLVDAKHAGGWELPVLGEVAAPPAVLIRPDGYVAWVGDLTDPALPETLATWFGPASPPRPPTGRDSGPVQPPASFRSDLYRGTAPFYDRYRPGYPAAMLDDLCARVRVSGTGRLLDLACGTGQIAIPLADRFAAVVAVDQEPETVAFGRAKAESAGNRTIRWVAGSAETVGLDPGFELVAVGTAFHRVNRPIVAARMFSWLRPGGGVALLWSDGPSRGDAPWQQALTDLLAAWMARIGTSDRIPPGWQEGVETDPHEVVLTGAGFEYLGRFEFMREERWTAETLAGYLYSTSILNQAALGDKVAELERDLSALVGAHGSGEAVVAKARYAYQLGRRPI